MSYQRAAAAAVTHWHGEDAVIAVAVAAAETGEFNAFRGDPASNYPQYAHHACSGFLSFGYWQVFLGVHHDKLQQRTGSRDPCVWATELLLPEANAEVAHEVWRERVGWGLNGFEAWSMYKNGRYEEFMGKAREAVDAARQSEPGGGVTPDGWLTWAVRMPGRPGKVNGGVNPGRGVFFHSAEGYAPHLLDLAVDGPLSWHGSITFDGKLYQHYPLTARCWHASAANNDYLGFEFEGKVPENPTLTDAQIDTASRLVKDISAFKGWAPKRPANIADKTHTLWEHREVTRLGGSATVCPSGRIPWVEILRRLEPEDELPSTKDAAHAIAYLYPAFWRRDRNLLHDYDKQTIREVVAWMDGRD